MSGNISPSAPTAALRDVRVLELSFGLAGPLLGRHLASWGAQVIRIETNRHLDQSRRYMSPRIASQGYREDISFLLTELHAGKLHVGIDLANTHGRELGQRVASVCDVVIENLTPGAIDRLGLSYQQLARVNPELIMVSMPGFGLDGPKAGYRSWGHTLQAASGLMDLTGRPGDSAGIGMGSSYPDYVSARHALIAILAALLQKRRTGMGKFIEVAQLDCALSTIGPALTAVSANLPIQRVGNASATQVQGLYPCLGDDEWCAIAIPDDVAWRGLLGLLGDPRLALDGQSWTADERLLNETRIHTALGDWTIKLTPEAAASLLQEKRVPANKVCSIRDLLQADPQLKHRQFHQSVAHPVLGATPMTSIAALIGSRGILHPRGIGSKFAQDNAHVFTNILGMTPQEIDTLVSSGAIENSISSAPVAPSWTNHSRSASVNSVSHNAS